jgi:hypothetical protein
MQERVESGLIATFIEHKPTDRFVINTHAFHNAHLLRAMLPRPLVAPIPLHQNRQAKHFEIAGNLRITQETKRATAKARAADKKLVATDSGSKKRKRPGAEATSGAEVGEQQKEDTHTLKTMEGLRDE